MGCIGACALAKFGRRSNHIFCGAGLLVVYVNGRAAAKAAKSDAWLLNVSAGVTAICIILTGLPDRGRGADGPDALRRCIPGPR